MPQFLPGWRKFANLANGLKQDSFHIEEVVGKSLEEINALFTQKFGALTQALQTQNRLNARHLNEMQATLDNLCQFDASGTLQQQMNTIRATQNENQKKTLMLNLVNDQHFIAMCSKHVFDVLQATSKNKKSDPLAKAAESAMKIINDDKDQRYRQAGYSYESLPGKMLMDIFRYLIDICCIFSGRDPIFTHEEDPHHNNGQKEVVKYLKQ